MNRPGTYQHVSAGSLSLLVHGLFLLFLLFSVSWRSLPHPQVEAELWSVLPEPPAPIPRPAPLPAELPPPEAVKQPEVAKPDIALEKAEKKRREQEALHLKELARQEEQARLDKEKAEQERVEKEKADKLRQERERRELERKKVEQELARQASAELDDEELQLRSLAQKRQAAANASIGRRALLIREAQERIRSRIRAYLRMPPNLVGNPEAVFQVTLLPNGEVLRATLVHGSGQATYDQEVERAILKASPLPLPPDRDAASAFRDGLLLKFRPREEVVAGR